MVTASQGVQKANKAMKQQTLSFATKDPLQLDSTPADENGAVNGSFVLGSQQPQSSMLRRTMSFDMSQDARPAAVCHSSQLDTLCFSQLALMSQPAATQLLPTQALTPVGTVGSLLATLLTSFSLFFCLCYCYFY